MKFPLIIANNCAGGNFYHNHLNLQFYSPFIWNVLSTKSILNIMNNWKRGINWFNYKIVENKNIRNTFSVVIDNLFTIHYVHYYYDANANEPIYKGANVHYKNIKEFIKQKYEERTKRMLEYADLDNPLFIIHKDVWKLFSADDIDKIIKIYDFKKVIVSNLKLPNEKNLKSIMHDNLLPQNMIEKYGNEIQSFFNIDESIKKLNSVNLNKTTNHQ